MIAGPACRLRESFLGGLTIITSEMEKKARAFRNIGPASEAWLHSVGIFAREDLERVGALFAFELILKAGHPATLNLLYALHAALADIDWREISLPERLQLKEEFALIKARIASETLKRRKFKKS